ncbi:MAG TPA: thioredoxin domain-containing protein [Gaiellaceae bacterium]
MSGRKARQRRRVPTPPPAAAATPAADRRVLLLAAAIGAVALVAAAVGLTLALGGGKSSPKPAAAGVKLAETAGVRQLFAGIPQHGLVLGAADAPVTLVEYLDLQCPYCGTYARETFPAVVTRFVRPGRVRVELRPLDFVGPDSVRGRNALFAAAEQNHAFEFTALLYANQGQENTGWLSDEMVRAAARSIRGVDAAAVAGAGTADAVAARIESQRAAEKVTGVPTFFVKRTGASGAGTELVNPSASSLEAALRAA